jgi:hypothetical protein
VEKVIFIEKTKVQKGRNERCRPSVITHFNFSPKLSRALQFSHRWRAPATTVANFSLSRPHLPSYLLCFFCSQICLSVLFLWYLVLGFWLGMGLMVVYNGEWRFWFFFFFFLSTSLLFLLFLVKGLMVVYLIVMKKMVSGGGWIVMIKIAMQLWFFLFSLSLSLLSTSHPFLADFWLYLYAHLIIFYVQEIKLQTGFLWSFGTKNDFVVIKLKKIKVIGTFSLSVFGENWTLFWEKSRKVEGNGSNACSVMLLRALLSLFFFFLLFSIIIIIILHWNLCILYLM